MSNFEQRWEEAFSLIKETNKTKFGDFADVMSNGLLEFKPMFELFYKQGQEDISGNSTEDLEDLK